MKQNLARNLYEEKTGEGLRRSVAARHRVSPTAAARRALSKCHDQGIQLIAKGNRIFMPSSVSVASLEGISWRDLLKRMEQRIDRE